MSAVSHRGLCRDGRQATGIPLSWAESGEEEKTIVKGLATLLETHHELPIITWGWDDIRRLAKTAWRLKVKLPEAVFRRYRDLYKEFDEAVRIPAKKMSLEAVATWLGFKRRSTLPKGDIWRVLDRDYCNRNKKQMIEYNRDDLDMLILVCDRVVGLKAE